MTRSLNEEERTMEKRTIRVTGKGKISVKPDTTRLTITLNGISKEYADTLSRSSRDTEALKDLMSAFGFERSDLKTLRFDVNTEYETYKYKGEYKQRFAGYRYNHVLKLQFDSDNDRLGMIVYSLAHCDLNPDFQISYTVKDPETAKNTLLGKAVEDAKAKAHVLAKASGVTLKEILRIDYSWGEQDLEVRPAQGLMMAKSMADGTLGRYNLDIEPEDIVVTDTVTVVWEIG